MKVFNRIIAGFSAVAILFANICVASADVSSDPGVKADWWTGFLHGVMNRANGVTIAELPLGAWISNVAAGICGQVCDASDDHWHHADESDYLKVSEGSDGTYAVRAKCKYCHKEFIATGLTADSLSTAYSDYVNTLPAQGYDSAGTLLWQPNWSDTNYWNFSVSGTGGTTKYFSSADGQYSNNSTSLVKVSFSGTQFFVNALLQEAFYLTVGFSPKHTFVAPISGRYTCITPICQYRSYESTGGTYYNNQVEKFIWQKATIFNSGDSVPLGDWGRNQSAGTNWCVRASLVYTTPIFSIEPSATSLITNNYYISTRVNNFNGDYYDSVTNNYYNNTTIINETTNNYYDMTTNNNYTMSNWSYDYASRTYFITLEDGTTVTVQFGDDCMTITKNDVTNSYQYVIKNNSTPDTPTTCKHDWQETIDTAPTCLEGGHASYTCSLCGETYEQNLAAKGHDWKVIEHVNMVYNSDGTVATQGHTLYQCSVCGEQWYTDTGAPPPDVSGSSNILAWLQAFQTWLDEKLDLTPVLERLDAILAQLQSTSGSATCEHTYEQHMEQDADCTLPGLQVSTCSQCGDSYSEIIDPLGHDWVISSHVDAVTDPDTGEETASAYDIYTCSRCGKTYEDHTGDGAPDEDYSSSSISQLVVKVFSKLGTFAGKLIGFIVRLFDKAISSVDEVISKFNEYTEQISGFGGDYPAWLTDFWTVLPPELQVALTFAVVCMVLGIVGKKLFFS